MSEKKNIEYKNGMVFSCGPPIRSGGYKNWNWCRRCSSIWQKDQIRCGTCNQVCRAKSKNNPDSPSSRRTKKEADAYRIKNLLDLRKWERERDRKSKKSFMGLPFDGDD